MNHFPRIAFWVFGCRLNQAEAEGWRDALLREGAELVSRESADVLVMHTCAVTAPAAHEAEKSLRAFRSQHPHVRVIVSGCATTLLPPGLADAVIPHSEKGSWLMRVRRLLTDWGFAATSNEIRVPRGLKARASLIVQDGCDRFCAYCIVPHLRGGPVSVPMKALVSRAQACFAEGFQEIVLTGCHLALYRDPERGADFLELLRQLCAVPGEGRFRIGSLEPCVLDDAALIRFIAQSKGRVCPFLHFPMQSASDTVLQRMGRPYRKVDLERLLDTLCAELPLCGLGADWIAGLPGETEADAKTTQAFIAAYPFTGGHIFPYSRRPGTPAASFPDQVPQHRITARAAALSQVVAETRARVLPSFLGRTVQVIPERQRGETWEGWSEARIRCRIPAPAERRRLTPFTPTVLDGDVLTFA